ncbi:MAG TPA: periplasmic heavy metal sensor [Casimicrobiaceae bacterium]|nr:periplasmic heavy metal sensor [Casimicrobiaceae bacterium]
MKRMLVAALLGLVAGWVTLASAHPMDEGSPISILGRLKAQLNLNTSQQQQWENAAALSASAHSAMRAQFQQRKAALEAELAKAEPDFASLAAANDSARAQMVSQEKQARDAWLALYSTFTPEQKGVVRDALKTRIDQMDARRAAHQQARHGTTSTN